MDKTEFKSVDEYIATHPEDVRAGEAGEVEEAPVTCRCEMIRWSNDNALVDAAPEVP